MSSRAATQLAAFDRAPCESAAGSPVEAARPAASRRLLIAVIGLAFAAHLHILLIRNVNWDEFWFLALVYDYARGTLAVPLQSFHVHFFGWLPAIGGDEVDQIVAGRLAFLGLLIGTCACAYRLARGVASVDASWFAVLCCAGYTNILYHGTSFRTDGLCVFLLMAALVLAHSRASRLAAVSASALLAAVALLVTIKSVFFVPTVVAAVIAGSLRESRIGAVVKELLLFGAILAAGTAGLYLWHARSLGGPSAIDSMAFLQGSADKAVIRDLFFPGLFAFRETVRGNLIQWGFLLYALGLLAHRLIARHKVVETWGLLALAGPLLSLLFYRNAFPYFFVFLMPPALVLCALTFDEWTRRSGVGPLHDAHLTVLATLAIGVGVVWYGLRPLPDGTIVQRQVIGAVHEIFPEPVPYIDRTGIIASFPKVGLFMSSWGLDNYRAERTPIFADLLRSQQPKLLIDNGPALSAALGGRGTKVLFEEDAAALRESFVRYWGPVYVAGRQMRLEPAAEATWDVLVAGRYRLESEGPVAVGGSMYAPGSTIVLPTGRVSLRSETPQEVTLRTADAGPPPPYPPPDAPLFTGFGLSGPTVVLPR